MTWSCPNCPNSPEFQHAEFMNHLREVHKITDTKGNKRLTLHLNCGDQSIYNFEWTIGGLTFHQSKNIPKKNVLI